MKNRFDTIKEHFERMAGEFDRNFVRFAPHYEDAIAAMVSAIPFRPGRRISVLDIGCGTGNITKAVLKKYPGASVTCIDLSANMIAMAKAKLKKYKSIGYNVCDIRDFKFTQKYDTVVSSLVMHHVEGGDKNTVYRKIYNGLVKGGVFYNVDITLGSNKYLQDMYMTKWMEFLRSGCTPSEIKRIRKNHKREDRPAKLMDELKSLALAGFKDIDVLCKWYYFSVYGGIK